MPRGCELQKNAPAMSAMARPAPILRRRALRLRHSAKVTRGATGALAGSLSDYGINDDFIKDLGSNIKPNSSALFLLIRRVTADKVLERLHSEGFTGHVLQTNLTNEQEQALRKAIGDAVAAPA